MPQINNFDAYFNLHQKIWSLRSRTTGRVTSHTSEMLLHDVQFVVQPAGRRRALEEGVKNVHAFARTETGATLQPERPRREASCPHRDSSRSDSPTRGFGIKEACKLLTDKGEPGLPYTGVPISYNPFKADFFYSTDFGWEVTAAEYVRLGVTEDKRPICIGFGIEHGSRRLT